MFPLADDDTGRRTLPFVTYALILMNVLFFLLAEKTLSRPGRSFRPAFQLIPRVIR
jgi:hypothetical protein